MSVSSPLSLSLVTASPIAARPAPRSTSRPLAERGAAERGVAERNLVELGAAERGLVQNALGPDERLLAALPGHDARGAVTWLLTNQRLIVLSATVHDDVCATVSTSAITCVELRTDPMGTWLRVRATGRQCTLSHSDAAQAAKFAQLLRERAGIGGTPAPAPTRRAAGLRDSMRAGFNGLTPHSPR